MNLIDAMAAEYSRSKRGLSCVIWLSVGIYGLAVVGVFYPAGLIANAIGIIALAAQLILFGIRYYSETHFNLAEQARRLLMLQDGLNIKPSDVELARLKERMGQSNPIRSSYVAPYYESCLPFGPQRLLEIIEESAFFTTSLARTASALFGGISALGLLVVFLGMVVLLQYGAEQTILEAGAKVLVVSMAFWAAGDIAAMSLNCFRLHQGAERVLSRCETLLSRGGELRDEALILLGEYNCSVLQSPPIPETIYKYRQAILNEAWRNRQSSEGEQSHAS